VQTFFATDLLRSYQQAGATIVYEDQKRKKRWLLPPAGVIFEGSTASFSAELKLLNTVYICDCGGVGSGEPETCGALTIVLSSPDRTHYKHWLKDGHVTMFMPLWSLDEVRAVVPAVHAAGATDQKDDDGKVVMDAAGHAVQVDAYQQRFRIHGGVARIIFSPHTDKHEEDALTKHISTCNVKNVIHSATTQPSASTPLKDVTFRLLRFDVQETDAAGAPYFQEATIDFASESIMERLMTRKEAEHINEVVEFLQEGGAPADTSSLRGKMFERYAHGVLSAGGDFRARWEADNTHAEVPVTFKPSTQRGVVNDLKLLNAGVRVCLNRSLHLSCHTLTCAHMDCVCSLCMVSVSPLP